MTIYSLFMKQLYINCLCNKGNRTMVKLGKQFEQMTISVPSTWRSQLEKIARIMSVEEEATLTYGDLIRRALEEKYNLKSPTEKVKSKNTKKSKDES